MKREISILVVEDDPFLLDILAETLRQWYPQVHIAAHGKEALTVLEAQRVDLVISDVQMPQMNGEQLVQKMREKHPSEPPILLLTGEARLDEAGALRLGANGLLHKPVSATTLFDRVEALLPK